MSENSGLKPPEPDSSGSDPLAFDAASGSRHPDLTTGLPTNQLESIFATLSDGLIVYDLDGRIQLINPAARRILGLDAAPSVTDLPWPERNRLFAPRDFTGRLLDPPEWPLTRLLAGEALDPRQPLEVLMHTLDGRDIIGSFTWTVLRDANQAISGAVLLIRDETESHRTATFLQQFAEATPLIVWITDADGRTIYANRRLTDYTGLSIDELCRGRWIDIVHPDDREQCVRYLKQAIREGVFLPMECRYRRASDGSYRWHLCQAASVRDFVTQKIIRWIGTSTDIDDQKQIEEKLRASEQRKDEFLGIASHELRTPLTGIKVGVQMSLIQVGAILEAIRTKASASSAKEQEQRLDRIQTSLKRVDAQVNRLTALVSDLLDVSRIQAGVIEFRPTHCRLDSIIQEVIEGQRQIHPNRTITFERVGLGGSLIVLADPDRVNQVILNLLTNALKYAPPSEPIEVTISRQDGHAKIAVRDRGPGLPPEEQELIWTRFYRAPGIPAQSGSGVGLGLGLHICRTIVEWHGGTVGVDSQPGHGSTFWFTLPIEREE